MLIDDKFVNDGESFSSRQRARWRFQPPSLHARPNSVLDPETLTVVDCSTTSPAQPDGKAVETLPVAEVGGVVCHSRAKRDLTVRKPSHFSDQT